MDYCYRKCRAAKILLSLEKRSESFGRRACFGVQRESWIEKDNYQKQYHRKQTTHGSTCLGRSGMLRITTMKGKTFFRIGECSDILESLPPRYDGKRKISQ